MIYVVEDDVSNGSKARRIENVRISYYLPHFSHTSAPHSGGRTSPSEGFLRAGGRFFREKSPSVKLWAGLGTPSSQKLDGEGGEIDRPGHRCIH